MDHEKAVLLVNLGSPDSFETKDVRRYLGEFLMDENVIDVPYLLRLLIVKGFILPFRPKESGKAYKSIWWEEGSPLIVISRRLEKKLANSLDVPVALGMRYGSLSIENGMRELLQSNPSLKEIYLIPLYPHYAMASTKTVIDKAKEVIAKNKWTLKLNTLTSFHNEPNYIKVLSESIRPYAEQDFDHILFSYHGIPERHLKKMDASGSHCLQVEHCCQVASPAHEFCYRHQCFETTRLVCEQLDLAADRWSLSFQSRLGSDAWLKPYTDKVLVELAEKGVKRLAVACPAFVSDCLETLEEIGDRGKEDFIEAGGAHLELIPCLNDSDDFVQVLAGYSKEALKMS